MENRVTSSITERLGPRLPISKITLIINNSDVRAFVAIDQTDFPPAGGATFKVANFHKAQIPVVGDAEIYRQN